MIIEQIKRRESWIYIGLWIIVVLICMLHLIGENSARDHSGLSWSDFGMLIFSLLPLLLVFLINNYLLIPRLLLRRKFFWYVIAAIIIVSAGGAFNWLEHPLEAFPNNDATLLPTPPRIKGFFPFPVMHGMVYSLLVVVLNVAICLASRMTVHEIEDQRLISANASANLKNLKAQVNPHFYMNMLNSIHGLVDVDPEKAKEMIIDMSRLMHYMLYDCACEKVSLMKEIDFLNNYIRTMKRRYPAEKVKITTSFAQGEKTRHIMVPPLLYLVFVENAFKHGVDLKYTTDIDIAITILPESIKFTCTNTIHPTYNSQLKIGGIGQANARERLKLIYAQKATLDINKTDQQYTVTLILPCNETENTHN